MKTKNLFLLLLLILTVHMNAQIRFTKRKYTKGIFHERICNPRKVTPKKVSEHVLQEVNTKRMEDQETERAENAQENTTAEIIPVVQAFSEEKEQVSNQIIKADKKKMDRMSMQFCPKAVSRIVMVKKQETSIQIQGVDSIRYQNAAGYNSMWEMLGDSLKAIFWGLVWTSVVLGLALLVLGSITNATTIITIAIVAALIWLLGLYVIGEIVFE